MIILIAALAIALLILGVLVAMTIKLQNSLLCAQSKLDAQTTAFKNLITEQEDDLGFGQHIVWRSVAKPTANTYRLVFDIDPSGQKVLNELTARFKRNAFSETERETCRRLGRAEVIDFIISRINTANDPRYNEQIELEYTSND